MTDALELAYLAGIFDGEGSVSILRCKRGDHRASYSLRVSVANTHLPTLDTLKEMFGGGISQKDKTHQRDCWSWYCGGKVAARCLRTLLPYLRIKVQQAEMGVAFQEEQQRNRAIYYSHYPKSIHRRYEDTYEAVKAVNRGEEGQLRLVS